MRTQLTSLRAALVLLLVGSGLLFAIGSTIERHQRHTEARPSAGSSTESGASGESGNEGGTAERTTHVEKGQGEAGAKILGVNTESVALMVVAIVASLSLALAVWLGRWSRLVLLCIVGFGLVFAAGDGRELVHQINESNAGLVAIAAILIGLHLAVTALAALLSRGGDASGLAAAEPIA